MSSDEQSRRGVAINMTLPAVNPNHKYRLVLMSPGEWRWLADLAFAVSDDSIYFMPLVTREYTSVFFDGSGAQSTHTIVPNTGFRFSFHASGIVNVDYGKERARIRRTTTSDLTIGPLFGLIINNFAELPVASVEDVNNPPGSVRSMPLTAGFFPGPIGLTFYRSRAYEEWRAPILSDLVQVNLHAPVLRKDVRYHVIVWQHQAYKPPYGDFAVLLPGA